MSTPTAPPATMAMSMYTKRLRSYPMPSANRPPP